MKCDACYEPLGNLITIRHNVNLTAKSQSKSNLGCRIDQGTEVMKLIKDTGKKFFSNKVKSIGTLVPRTDGITNVDDYINRLEYALQMSLETKSFGTVMNETPVGIA